MDKMGGGLPPMGPGGLGSVSPAGARPSAPPASLPQVLQQTGLAPPEMKQPATAPRTDTVVAREEPQESSTTLLPQPPQPPPTQGQLGDQTPIGDLYRQAQRKGDNTWQKALQELAQRDPGATDVSREQAPPAAQQENNSPVYRSNGNMFLQFLNRDDAPPGRTPGYRLFRLDPGDPNAFAELFERQFNDQGQVALSLDQKTLARPGGGFQRTTEKRELDENGQYQGMRAEEEVVPNFKPEQAPQSLKEFTGFEKFFKLLEQDGESNVEMTHVEQEALTPQQGPPPTPQQGPAPPPLPQARLLAPPPQQDPGMPQSAPQAQGPTPQPFPMPRPGIPQGATAGVIINLASMAQDATQMLADQGAYYQLSSEGGLIMELFMPKGMKKYLTIKGRQGQLLFWEEETEEFTPVGERVRRRTSIDRLEKLRRYVEERRRKDGSGYDESTRHRYKNCLEVGQEGREIGVHADIVKRFTGGVVELIEVEDGPSGGRRLMERRRNDDLLFAEVHEIARGPEGTVETVTRQDVKRGLEGEERIVSGGGTEQKSGMWRRGEVIQVEYSMQAQHLAEQHQRHKVISYTQPGRNAAGEIITHYDDTMGAAARLIRRQTTSRATAADRAGNEVRPLMAGRPEGARCLSVAPTRQVSFRWELYLYPKLEPDDEDEATEPPVPTREEHAAPRWVLQEDFNAHETSGTCRGAGDEVLSFLDRVIMRRSPGFGGSLVRHTEITSERYNSVGLRETLEALFYQDGRLLSQARGQSERVSLSKVKEQLASDPGVQLLRYLGEGDVALLETVRSGHPPSRSGAVVQHFSTHPAVAVTRVLRQQGAVPWSLRVNSQTGSAFQAFLAGTANTAWAVHNVDGRRSTVEIVADLPDCKTLLRANLRETTLETASMADVELLLEQHDMPPWEDLIEANLSVEQFDLRARERQDLVVLVRTLGGTRDNASFAGERLVVKTPEGDLLVLLSGETMPRPFGYFRAKEGQEHFSIPHEAGKNVLVLTSDEDGVFGELMRPTGPMVLGRLGEAFGGLLSWIESGRPLERGGRAASMIPEGFSERLNDLAFAIRGVGRFPGPDVETIKAVLWDFSRLAWGESPNFNAGFNDPNILLLIASGHMPLEVASLLLLGEFRGVQPRQGGIGELQIGI
ncbi:MAG: hypothetical protein ACYCW6_04590 [Candidatus Xenobia bacterium]